MIGPVGFIGSWAVLGAGAEGYDPTRDPISRLAALGAPTRPAMTVALVVLGVGMMLYSLVVRPMAARLLLVVNGMTALAVAALPLAGGQAGAHGVGAGVGYLTLAAIPVVVGGRKRLPIVTTLASAACLLASVLSTRDGLYQRAGLTVAHLWVVVSAVGLVRGRAPTSPSTPRPARAPAARRR